MLQRRVINYEFELSLDAAIVNKVFFFFSSRRRHTRWPRDWSSDVCSSDLPAPGPAAVEEFLHRRIAGQFEDAGGRAVRVYAPPDETEAGRLDRVPHGGEVTAGIAHAAADFGSRRGRDFDLATWLYREPALARQCAGGIKPGQRGSNPL